MSFVEELKQAAGFTKPLPGGTTHGASAYSLKTTNLKDQKMRPVKWLVRYLIPKGMFTLLAGHGGAGKSSLLAHMVASLTRGKAPFGLDFDVGPPMNVAIYNCEDAVDEVLVPRLVAAGADLSRVTLINGTTDSAGKTDSFSLLNIPELEEYHREKAFDLIIIDPISSTIGNAGANDNSETDIRPLLEALCAFCERTKVSAIGVKHLGKGERDTAAMRVLGSVAYSSVARMVLSLTIDPDDKDRRILARSKTNLPVGEPVGVTFRTEQPPNAMELIRKNNPDLSPEDAQELAAQMYRCTDFQPWNGDIESLVNTGNAKKPYSMDRSTKKSTAAAWMRDFLSDGPRHSRIVVSRGNATLGFDFTLDWWRAVLQDVLGGVTKKVGKDWDWALDNDSSSAQELTQDESVDMTEFLASTAQRAAKDASEASEVGNEPEKKEDGWETHTPLPEFAADLATDTELGMSA